MVQVCLIGAGAKHGLVALQLQDWTPNLNSAGMSLLEKDWTPLRICRASDSQVAVRYCTQAGSGRGGLTLPPTQTYGPGISETGSAITGIDYGWSSEKSIRS
ncbi:hypothetical protein F2P79_025244 [Pimephales promelas]|nr:hypothetical protein F2P79_025244 [Pimephales promelas]